MTSMQMIPISTDRDRPTPANMKSIVMANALSALKGTVRYPEVPVRAILLPCSSRKSGSTTRRRSSPPSSAPCVKPSPPTAPSTRWPAGPSRQVATGTSTAVQHPITPGSTRNPRSAVQRTCKTNGQAQRRTGLIPTCPLAIQKAKGEAHDSRTTRSLPPTSRRFTTSGTPSASYASSDRHNEPSSSPTGRMAFTSPTSTLPTNGSSSTACFASVPVNQRTRRNSCSPSEPPSTSSSTTPSYRTSNSSNSRASNCSPSTIYAGRSRAALAAHGATLPQTGTHPPATAGRICRQQVVSSPQQAVAATIACHSATRAGDVLGVNQMQAIIEQLAETPEPHRCPHGRPTIVQISTLRLEQEFRRR